MFIFMLGVITPKLFKTSETFIAQHIQKLAPGRTVVACFDSEHMNKLDCPAIHVIPENVIPLPRPARAIVNRWRYYIRGQYVGLSASESNRLSDFMIKYNVQSVLAEYGKTACIVQHACRRAGARLYVHFHGHDASKMLGNPRVCYVYRRLSRNLAGIIVPSQYLADKLVAIGMSPEKMRVIPCGVDVEKFVPEDRPDKNLVLAVGRFVDKKAPHHTINAFAKIAAKHSDARLEMIGDGPLLDECRELTLKCGLAGRVIFHGVCEHDFVRQKMAQAAIFVQHSVTADNGDTEGLPVGILEAMSSGLPVVSTRHAGIPEAVLDGQTGLLVVEHDVDGMAAALDRLLADSSLRSVMGEAGHTRALAKYSSGGQLRALRSFLGIKY